MPDRIWSTGSGRSFQMTDPFSQIAILGGGLLGGSLALALEALTPAPKVRLWARRPATLAEAKLRGISHPTNSLSEALAGADLVVLAVPVGSMAELLTAAIAAGLPSHCLVTDVGSVKQLPHLLLTPLLAASGIHFIGSHPMAGSEQVGISAANSRLFEGSACLLTNDDAAPESLAACLEAFWQRIGCDTTWLTSAAHDALVARISHLPHVLAASGARVCLADPSLGQFSGGGLRDTTRVAAGNPEMWAEILMENRAAIIGPLRESIADLTKFLAILEATDHDPARAWLATAKQLRDSLTPSSNHDSSPPMSDFRVTAISSLHAEFSVPGDKSMSHRAAILSALANGPCTVRNFLPSEDCLNTLHAMAALGAHFEVREVLTGYGPTHLVIHGKSMQLSAPSAPIDCGNSGTGMRLLAGLLAAQPFPSELFGDASLSSRPMGRITVPLGLMGAQIETRGEKPGCAPLAIHGTALQPITYEMPVASAQVKSAILLAGLFTPGTTTVVQPADTRDHTERMLASFGVTTERDHQAISITGGQTPVACDFTVPGDISSAAFWLVAAAALPGSRLLIKDVGLNPTRTAILAVLSRMGAHLTEILHNSTGEPIGNVEIHGSQLTGTTILPAEVPNLIDEIPVLAVAAALAHGRTVIRNARELRVKETDRIATVVTNLRAMGAHVEEFDDGMEIDGGHPLHGAVIDSFGDHRIAMAFAIAGLFASGETIVCNTACVNTSYPGFQQHLQAVLNHSTTPESFVLPTHADP